jgi:hypothetical protein
VSFDSNKSKVCVVVDVNLMKLLVGLLLQLMLPFFGFIMWTSLGEKEMKG